MIRTVWWLVVAAVVVVATHGVSAQGARAVLQHVSAADVNGTGTRRVCFSQQQANLYVLVTEAIDREQAAVGQMVNVDRLVSCINGS